MTASPRRDRMLAPGSRLPGLTHLVFDLEGTIIHSSELRRRTQERAIQCLARNEGSTEHDALSLFVGHRAKLAEELGYRPALSATLHSLGVSLEEWGRSQAGMGVPDDIQTEPRLGDLLHSLRGKMRVLLYSNMCAPLADRVLETAGLAGAFDRRVAPQEAGAAKPSPTTVNDLVIQGALVPSSTLSVGDRFDVDIAPIIDAGGFGYLIGSLASLSAFVDWMHLERNRD